MRWNEFFFHSVTLAAPRYIPTPAVAVVAVVDFSWTRKNQKFIFHSLQILHTICLSYLYTYTQYYYIISCGRGGGKIHRERVWHAKHFKKWIIIVCMPASMTRALCVCLSLGRDRYDKWFIELQSAHRSYSQPWPLTDFLSFMADCAVIFLIGSMIDYFFMMYMREFYLF